jgi:hypothetical protein
MPSKKTPAILNRHAKKAAQERYGVDLNKHARREITAKIRSSEAEFVCRSSDNRTLWKVPYEGETLNVVYDRKRQTLCTVLPKDAYEFQQPPHWSAEKAEARATRRAITDELRALWDPDSSVE